MSDVHAKLSFVTPETEHPKFIMQVGSSPAQREGQWHERDVHIRDARSLGDRANVDTHGFELITGAFTQADAKDAESLATYLQEVEQLLQKRFPASKVHLIDHTFRSSAPKNGLKPTAGHVHNDYSLNSIRTHLEKLFGEKAAKLAVRRGIAQVNVWHPLVPVVRVAPLAVVDGASVSPSDLVPAQIVYPDRVGEILQVRHRSEHRWYYYPEMTDNEVLLIKGYDSREDGQARYAPHAAFDHPDTQATDHPRKSIEVRALIEFEPRS